MRYLLLLFLPVYLLQAFGEINTWRKRSTQRWHLAAMIFSKIFLALGMIVFVFASVPPSLRDPTFRIGSVCITWEFYYAFRSAPSNARSIVGKLFDDLILVSVVLLFSGTAAFFTRLLTNTPKTAALHVLFFLLVAYLLARFWPASKRSASKPAADTAATELLKWLSASPHFQRVPDEIHLADQRTQPWPGFDAVPTSLYRVRFGEIWYVALAQPACHCFSKPIRPDVPLEKIYAAYKEWFADDVSKRMIFTAAKKFGNPRFESLVKDALADKPPDKSDG